MKILLLGGSGQLGFELSNRIRDLNFELTAPVSKELDVTDRKQVQFIVKKFSPDVIINCAAYTAVDLAEDEPKKAFALNETATVNIAKAAKKTKSFVIQISTDYVFSGEWNQPYKEEDPVGPISVYGESKLAGEKALQEILPDSSLIVRTSSLHGQRRPNFVHTMLKLFSEREKLQVVNDQFMTATWCGWLAEVIIDLARIRNTGIVHAACAGVISWHEFATTIYDKAKDHNPKILDQVEIAETTLANFPRKAKRPQYSALCCDRLESWLGRSTISWKEGLALHLKDIDYGNKLET